MGKQQQMETEMKIEEICTTPGTFNLPMGTFGFKVVTFGLNYSSRINYRSSSPDKQAPGTLIPRLKGQPREEKI